MVVALSYGPCAVFRRSLVKVKLLRFRPALLFKPNVGTVGDVRVKAVTVKRAFHGQRHQFISIGGNFRDGSCFAGEPRFFKQRPVFRLLFAFNAFIPDKAVPQNIIVVSVKSLRSGFDIHRIGKSSG
ncbi:MAG: hypothetical protein LBI94_08545 [Treponema sp.]|nr:hypothetical protein [Treponema sp.]